MSTTQTTSFPDFQGTEVAVGDRIAAVFSYGSTPELRTGIVVGFATKKSGYSDNPVDLLEVDWDATSSGWNDVTNSKIEARLKRFLKLN